MDAMAAEYHAAVVAALSILKPARFLYAQAEQCAEVRVHSSAPELLFSFALDVLMFSH